VNQGRSVFLSLAVVLGSLSVQANDWPQWRGPLRDGVSRESNLLQTWPAGGPALLWQVDDLGDGYATVAVAGSQLFTTGSGSLDNEYAQARSIEDGRVVWTTRIGNVGEPDQAPSYPKARSTPTLDGEQLYAFSSDGDLVCLNRTTGAVRWQRNVRREFGGQPGTWAYAESPLIDGDAVVVTPGGAKATMLALNKHTEQ
jgi:outer membrane protein assembly factor BamB